MPRLKTKEQRKMLKLHSLSELSKVVPVPEEAFAEPPEVPTGAFDPVVRKGHSPAPVYLRFQSITSAKKTSEYVLFVFTGKVLDTTFKGVMKGTRFELVQGREPHKDWFQLRTSLRGNKRSKTAGVNFSTTDYFNIKKIDKNKVYIPEITTKDGALFLKLPPELVPALR